MVGGRGERAVGAWWAGEVREGWGQVDGRREKLVGAGGWER